MRLFVGVELGDALLTSLNDDIARVRQAVERAAPGLPVRWVPGANLHITLVFIGEVGDDAAAPLIVAVQPPIRVAPFDLEIATVGTFPRSGPPRVIWLGVAAGATDAACVYDQLTPRLEPFGCEREARGYTPHLTIARVKDGPASQAGALRDAIRTTAVRGGVTRIASVTLFRSRLSSRGSTYEPLLRVPLQG